MASLIANQFVGRAEDGRPKYALVKERLQQRIRDQGLSPGAALPADRELAETFGVSVITIKRAMSDLAQQGLIRRAQGRGTFVQDPGAVAATLIPPEDEQARPAKGSSVLFLSCLQSIRKYSVFLDFIERGLVPHDLPLMYSVVQEINASEAARLRRLVRRGGVKSVLLIGVLSDEMIRFVRELCPCVIVVGSNQIQENVTQVCSDVRGGVRAAADLLVGSGVTRLGLLNGHHRYATAVILGTAFEETVKAMGGRVEKSVVEWNEEPVDHAMHAKRLLDNLGWPCGVIAEGENATALIRECAARGLRVPQDVRVIGFDSRDREVQDLTCVYTDWEADFPGAIQTIIGQLIGRPVPFTQRCCLPWRLRWGRTCTPPQAARADGALPS